MQVTTYGVDLAKQVFQVHWVTTDSGEVKRKTLTRGQMQAFFARRAAGVVAMEACGSAHHWGRALKRLGHQVRLISVQFVRPFVKSNRTDAADAQGIWEAAQRPEMRFVALKSEQQQALMGLHRIRAQLVKQRTMQANQVRGLLYEFGVVVPKSWRALLAQAGPILADTSCMRIPELIRGELLQQLQGLRELTARIEQLQRSIGAYRAQEEQCRRIEAIHGVGALSSTAIVASVGDARASTQECGHCRAGQQDSAHDLGATSS
jgi:transposase